MTEPAEPIKHVIDGHLEQCIACWAPVIIPFPPDWCVDLTARGSAATGPVRTTFTPHRPGCIMQPMRFEPGTGMSVRVQGENIASLNLRPEVE